MVAQTLLHLIYIHGFQGNDTTFQSFPTDLQQHLVAIIPNRFKVQSSLYPTYKSVKPISYATRNFLEWLNTQPPGPVILMGHSMGGLLAAEAATYVAYKARQQKSTSRRIVAMIAFDTPYLGMHPHVVKSGIASLFAKKDEALEQGGAGGAMTTSQMNDPQHVDVVDEKVTDDWQAFKHSLAAQKPSQTSLSSGVPVHSRTPSPSPSPRPSPPPSPVPPSLIEQGLAFLPVRDDNPLVRWVRKHADDPFTAGKRWIIEHFQFGICMFDPSGLKERYGRLVEWDGMWVNYWTESGSGNGSSPGKKEQRADNDAALVESGIAKPSTASSAQLDPSSSLKDSATGTPPSFGPPTKSEAKAVHKAEEREAKASEKEAKQAAKAAEKESKAIQKAAQSKAVEKQSKPKSRGHHFIVLPTGLGQVLGGLENWEKIQIAGVQDEVAAHCGLFIRGQNLDYDGLVEKVGQRVLRWCERL